MDQDNNGATNGAPQEKEEITCVIVAGDFLKLLLEERSEKNITDEAISSGTINSLRENDIPIVIKLENNTEKDVAFIKMCEENPLIAKMRLTKEEWNARLEKYISEHGTDKEV